MTSKTTIEILKRDKSVLHKFENVNLDMTVLEFKKMFLTQCDYASKYFKH